MLEWDGFVQCIDTPDESKCDLRPVYIECNHKEGFLSTIVISGEAYVLNAELPPFKLTLFGALWDNLISKREFPPQTP